MVTLYGKEGKVNVGLPQDWKVVQTIFKEIQGKRRPLSDLITEALEKPVDFRRLEDILKPTQRVAIVVDDLTRPTPVREILPPLLRRIHQYGIQEKNVDLVIGVGTHRPMTQEEIQTRLGEHVASVYRIQNHDAWSAGLTKVGEIPGYESISMNATVVRADVKIVVGSILPHPHNGFGGGPKTIMPGICDAKTVLRHHLKNVRDHRSIIGNIKENPFYNDLCQIAGLAPADFSVNCLFDGFGQVSGVLAGDPLKVHEAGTQRMRDELGVQVLERADITVVSSYPYDEGPQVVKPVLPAAMVTKPKGTILLWSEISAELPESFLENVAKVRGDGGDEAEACVKRKLCRVEPLIEELRGVDFNLALVLIFFVSRKFRVILVDKLLQGAASRMGFEYAPDLATAIDAERRRKKNPTVNVIPAGGYVFPVILEEFCLVDA